MPWDRSEMVGRGKKGNKESGENSILCEKGMSLSLSRILIMSFRLQIMFSSFQAIFSSFCCYLTTLLLPIKYDMKLLHFYLSFIQSHELKFCYKGVL